MSPWWSRCSRSIPVTTAQVGNNRRNEPSLSSASATSRLPLPSLAELPNISSLPPITIVGSSPQRDITWAIIEVVEVLPCEPATATAYFIRINSPSISARGMTGTRRRCASAISGFSASIAVLTTTTSAPATAAAW